MTDIIKNIVFDMGKVLLNYDPSIALEEYFDYESDKKLIQKELFDGPEWIEGDLGIITNEQRYDGVSRRVPKRLHNQLKRCVEGWDICMEPITGAKEFVEYVKNNGYNIYVLSNACSKFYEYFPGFLQIDYFDGVVVSSDVHMVKPDNHIYEYLLERYNLNPRECLFIDDREENVEAAIKSNMKAVVFNNNFDIIKENFNL